MATPLSAIGKYAGVLMAAMCVLLMFAFVIGDPLMQSMGSGGGGGTSSRDTEVVATWEGGQINERQLDQAVMHRNVLAQFQETVIQTGARAAVEDGVDLEFAGLRVRPIDLPRTREQGVEGSVVRTKIFAERARQAGMVVSDDMIVDYLRALGFDRVSNDQMREVLSRMNTGGGRRATITFVFDLLREAMLANNYLTSHTFAFRTILPEERWEDWRKVNERVVVEAAPVPVEGFLDKAPEPTDAELEEFFAEHRDRSSTTEVLTGYGNVELPSALPAFTTPPRVKLSVLKAEFAPIADGMLAEVTDEEVAAYYEKNKESFVAADRTLFGDDSVFGPSDTLPGEGDEDVMEGDTEPAAKADSEAEADPADAAPEEPASDEDSTEEAPAESANEADAPEEKSENPLRDPKADGAKADGAQSNGAQSDAVEEEEEEEESADKEGTSYQPLEEVADEIRRRLANERAERQLQEKMGRIQTELQDIYQEYYDARFEATERGDDAPLPEPPDALTNLKPLAEKESLELTELDQAPQIELRETPVGASILTDPASGRAVPLWYLAFREDDVDSFDPLLTYDMDGGRYIVLVTKRYDAETPTLEEARERVVAAWKRTKAAELALEAAKEFAEEVGASGQSIADFVGDKPEALVQGDAIEKTDPFALFSLGQVAPNAQQVPLRLSQPEPLVAPGPDLLKAVFDLRAGEATAALNHDHSIAYAMRIAEKIGTDEELRREFLRDGDNWIGAPALMQARATNKLAALLGTLLDESGLEWRRDADQVR